MKLTTEEIALCVMGLQTIFVAGHEKVRSKLEERMKLELESRGIVHTNVATDPPRVLSVTTRGNVA